MSRQIKTMADLRRLQAELARGNPELAANVARKAAAEMSKLAQTSFDARESPYGVPFGTGENGEQMTLNKSGKLRAQALRYTAQGRRIVASIGSVQHARYHANKGILPRQGQALPAHWQGAIQSIARVEIEQWAGAL